MRDKIESIYIGYGIGCYYDSVSKRVKEKIKLSYLCDRKWGEEITSYDNIPIVSQQELSGIENARVVIFPCDPPIKTAIASELEKIGVEYIFVDDLLSKRSLNGKIIKEEGEDGVWKDDSNNVIYFHPSIPNDIVIQLGGVDNEIYLEENIVINKLTICMGTKGKCRIGSNTRIIGATMYISYAGVNIGKDCLFSANISLRTHDAHHIFDRNTHKRINVSQDVVIDNHVWVGEGALLLPGARIGEGSIVGARAVTSAQFEDHVVIAGVPAKIIRKDVCWSKDATEFVNYMHMDECLTGDAEKYC